MGKNRKVRLIDMRSINDRDINYTQIMQDVFGYKNNWLNKRLFFKKTLKKSFDYMSEIRNIDPKNIKLNVDCKIICPKSTDYISFRAMMELKALLNGKEDKHIADLMAHTIAIVCYQEHTKAKKYDSNSKSFSDFKEDLYLEPALDMIGLYNHIMNQIDESTKSWNRRFGSVEVEDKDYELANRGRLGQFNVINTIKQICSDFNITYDEAWQMSYNLVQTNSYAKATANHVEDQMRQLKENRMKREKSRR